MQTGYKRGITEFFIDVKTLKKGTTDVYRRCKPTKKTWRMHLAFKNLKINRKWVTKCLKTKKQNTTNDFRG